MTRRVFRAACVRMLVLALATLGTSGAGIAATLPDPGRLFYTPAQRAQLEAARARNVTQARPAAPELTTPQATRYDGVLIRSDGKTTRWVDGEPQPDASTVTGLKPGQVRADGRVYEPYQVLRPAPAVVDAAPEASAKESSP